MPASYAPLPPMRKACAIWTNGVDTVSVQSVYRQSTVSVYMPIHSCLYTHVLYTHVLYTLMPIHSCPIQTHAYTLTPIHSCPIHTHVLYTHGYTLMAIHSCLYTHAYTLMPIQTCDPQACMWQLAWRRVGCGSSRRKRITNNTLFMLACY